MICKVFDGGQVLVVVAVRDRIPESLASLSFMMIYFEVDEVPAIAGLPFFLVLIGKLPPFGLIAPFLPGSVLDYRHI